jgi:adhesin transport system outer membrane protein
MATAMPTSEPKIIKIKLLVILSVFMSESFGNLKWRCDSAQFQPFENPPVTTLSAPMPVPYFSPNIHVCQRRTARPAAPLPTFAVRLGASMTQFGMLLGLTVSGAAVWAAPLQLNEALRLAATEHPTVAASRSERQAALMKLDVAERQRYPNLVAQSAGNAAGDRITTLRIEQPLWTGGRITGEIEVANATIRQSDAALMQAQQDIMLRVAAAFTELGRIRARQLAARDNVQEHERLASMIERRVASQVSPASDSIQANSRLSQARSELTQLDALALRALSALRQATGTTVTDVALTLPPRRLAWRGLDETLDAATDHAPALRKLQAELEAATAEIAVRRSGAFPRVSLRVDRTYGGSASGTQAYVGLDFQTGAGFSVQASMREAQARQEAIRSQIEALRRETIDEVSGDWADLGALSVQTTTLRSQVASTVSVYDSFVRQYAVGRKGWNDVLNAQREVAQARFQLADVESGALRSRLRLELITGLITAQTLDDPFLAKPQPPSDPRLAAQIQRPQDATPAEPKATVPATPARP